MNKKPFAAMAVAVAIAPRRCSRPLENGEHVGLRGIAADASQTPHTCGGGGQQETSSALLVHAGLPSATVANIRTFERAF
jgi:hypothetical protein